MTFLYQFLLLNEESSATELLHMLEESLIEEEELDSSVETNANSV